MYLTTCCIKLTSFQPGFNYAQKELSYESKWRECRFWKIVLKCLFASGEGGQSISLCLLHLSDQFKFLPIPLKQQSNQTDNCQINVRYNTSDVQGM